MEFSNYHTLLDMFVIIYGLNGLISCIKMYRTKKLIPDRLMIPGGRSPEDCIDPEGYLRHILPRASAFCCVNLICGGTGLLCTFFPQTLPPVLLNVTIPVLLINLVLFGVVLSGAIRRFWSD